MTATTLDIADVDATLAVGRGLGAALEPGHVLALIGPLGSGKTTLVKGIARGAGVADLRQVNSPTFVIVNEYSASRGRDILPIYHVDAYRLRGGGDLETLGFDEMCSRGPVVVEWADRVADLLPLDRLAITLEPVDDQRRRFHCQAGGPRAEALLQQVKPRS